MHGILCYLVRDQPPRYTWRFAVADRPVVPFARAESKRLGTKLYVAHTPLYGDETHVRQAETYFARYALGDGWFGPISSAQMDAVVTRLRSEGTAFLRTEEFK
ncbi:MAG: hypothetical protein RL685_7118 [Pseudomonadota bacterium]|jgi:hypothetical protein